MPINVPPPQRATLTIANGQTTSNAVQLGDYNSFILICPSAWTASTLTFEVSIDGVTWRRLYDDVGGLVTISDATIQATLPDAISNKTLLTPLFGATWLRLRAGAAQGAQRDWGLIAKRV